MNSVNEIYTSLLQTYENKEIFFDRHRNILQLKYPDISIFIKKNQPHARIWHKGSSYELQIESMDKAFEFVSGIISNKICLENDDSDILRINHWTGGLSVQSSGSVFNKISGIFNSRKAVSAGAECTELRLVTEKNTESAVRPVRINFNHGIKSALTDSKICGLPYWNPSVPYPTDRSGKKMLLLAQINLSQLPANNMVPSEGLLQFFVPDIQMPEYTFRPYVVFHPVYDRKVSADSIRNLGVSEITKNSLFRSEYLLTFSTDKSVRNTGCHLFGGSASDPSGSVQTNSYYNVHLLQLDTDDSYMRFHFSNFKEQTTGSFSFFINENDLKSLDFRNVQIRWKTQVWNG